LVLAFTMLGLAASVGLTLATIKVYQANVQVFVATATSSDPTQLAQGNTFTQDRVQSYTSIADSPSVTGAVIDELGLTLSQQELADKITADAPLNKVLINLHVTDHNPKTAAKLANAVAAQFDRVVQSTEQTDASGRPVVKLTVIHPATVPTSPIKPNRLINIGLGFLVGLLIGIGLVVLRDVLDNTIKGPSDFEVLGVSVLGMVPFDKRTAKTPIAFRGDPHSLRSEAYRLLRTNLQFLNVDNAPRIIAVTSSVPGEGKSTTAINLAAALAEAGYRVCLIEADLRRPTIAKTLGLVPDVGFTTVLIGHAPIEAAMQSAGRNLAVLTSGPVPPNPSELLVTEQAGAVIRQVAEQVDYTIIDTAPLLPVADGAEVAALADATLLVHRAGKTTRDQSARAVETLRRIGERPVGVILNMVTRSTGRYDYEYNYYYSYRPDRSRKAKGRTPAVVVGNPVTLDAAADPSYRSGAPRDPNHRAPSARDRAASDAWEPPVWEQPATEQLDESGQGAYVRRRREPG
jgi:capsular exopolysaccharide synthesis family protein